MINRTAVYQLYELQYYEETEIPGFTIDSERMRKIIINSDSQGNFSSIDRDERFYRISEAIYFDKAKKRKISLNLDDFLEFGKPFVLERTVGFRKVE